MGALVINGQKVAGVNIEIKPEIYSTEEREVGVWTDGKPLYQKTVIATNLVSGNNTVSNGISNIESIIENTSFIFKSGSSNQLPCISSVSGWSARARDFSATDFVIELGSSLYSEGFTSASVTLLYTKTTDQPGSGTWTTDGAYAHHYSTDEKVIGTWIDGSTLYEKTVEINNIAFDNDWHNVAHGVSNIDKVISCVGIMFGADGEFFNIPQYRANTSQGVTFGIQGTSSEYIGYINNWYNNPTKIFATIQYTKSS